VSGSVCMHISAKNRRAARAVRKNVTICPTQACTTPTQPRPGTRVLELVLDPDMVTTGAKPFARKKTQTAARLQNMQRHYLLALPPPTLLAASAKVEAAASVVQTSANKR
jgi:hypothetical protein